MYNILVGKSQGERPLGRPWPGSVPYHKWSKGN